ncbi:MAG TPA: signal recognition particle protein [Acidobacteriota bacterium]
MFEQLNQRLQKTLGMLRGVVRVDEESLGAALRDLRMALLEADVNYGVVKDFLAVVRERAQGQEILRSLTPGQQVVKVVYEEMTRLLGGARVPLRLQGASPHVVMLVGLQGAGKTTTAAKLGHQLRGQGHSPLLASVDVHRPAAREQLAQIAADASLAAFEGDGAAAVPLARQAVEQARSGGHDVVVLDTAGRLHLDEAMMGEAADLVAALDPGDVVYVADALAGQDAVNTVKVFAERLPLTGTILTKLDGDARGGVALSIVAVTGLPILYVGVGERFEELEPFHPERMASRILGMGDVLTLIEKAQESIDVEQATALEKRLREATFTLEDFREQMRQMGKMGSLSKLLEMLPMGRGFDAKAIAPAEEDIRRFGAIIDSMTADERRHPQKIDGSRRRRIARGSGTRVQDVNQLLKQFATAKKLMKKLGRQKGKPMDLMGLSGLRS